MATQATQARNPIDPKLGDVVGLLNGGKVVDCTVTAIRGIRKGRRAGMVEYTLAPVSAGATTRRGREAVGFRCLGTRLFCAPRGSGYGDSERRAAAKRLDDCRAENAERKAARAEAGRAVLGEPDWATMRADLFARPGSINIKPGDRVTVRYTNGSREETVEKVNFATGKIAIRQAWNKTGVRWLPATMVTAVRAPERDLPCAITPERQAKLSADGWFQVTFSNGEFITSSYVVATTREAAARKGTNYDCASATVYQDPATKLYHRATGSFD